MSLVILMWFGSRTRIVVFVDFADLVWTAGIILIPIFGLLVIMGVGAMTLPQGTPMTWQTLADYPMFGATVGMVAALWSYAFVGMYWSIRFNGPVVGLVVACLKVFAATLLAILTYFAWKVWLDEYRQGHRANYGLIASMFAVLGWTAMSLINGERVMDYNEQFVEDYV